MEVGCSIRTAILTREKKNYYTTSRFTKYRLWLWWEWRHPRNFTLLTTGCWHWLVHSNSQMGLVFENSKCKKNFHDHWNDLQ
jgi:hypothetical protein